MVRALVTTATEYSGRAFDWLRQQEMIVLLTAMLIAGCTWGFIEIADEVTEGETRTIDERILTALRAPDGSPIGPPWVSDAVRDVTALGGTTVLTLTTAVVAGFLAIRRKPHAMWLVIAATWGGMLLMSLLKNLFSRPRPSLVPHLHNVHSYSFPSGHSMLSAVVYLTLAALATRLVKERSLKAYLLAVAMLLTIAVGLSRVYLGVHYPTDVLAGWTLGLGWAAMCWLLARFLQRRGAVEPPAAAPVSEPVAAQIEH